MPKVTVCLTSCNRFDLLQRTLDSFFSLNTYPIEKFIIAEDSTKTHMKDQILSHYGNKVELIFNEINLGPYKSIDNLYSKVETDYIFHSEDDWEFLSNPNFISESMEILEERQDIHQVWIRKDADPNWIENDIYSTKSNVNFRMMKVPHCGDWCGFSHNPGLRRKSDYTNMFPNGFAEFIQVQGKAVLTEFACNMHARKQGYRAAILENRSCIHIGGGRSTIA